MLGQSSCDSESQQGIAWRSRRVVQRSLRDLRADDSDQFKSIWCKIKIKYYCIITYTVQCACIYYYSTLYSILLYVALKLRGEGQDPYHHTIPYHTQPHGHWCAFTDLYHTIPYHTIPYHGCATVDATSGYHTSIMSGQPTFSF